MPAAATPKIELHVHLEGAVRPAGPIEVIEERGHVVLARVSLFARLWRIRELRVRRGQDVAPEVVGHGVQHAAVVGEVQVEVLVPWQGEQRPRRPFHLRVCRRPASGECRRLEGPVGAPQPRGGEHHTRDRGQHLDRGLQRGSGL